MSRILAIGGVILVNMTGNDLDLVATEQTSGGDPMSQRTFRWFHFSVLTGLGVLGVIAVFPFVLAAFADKLAKISVPLPMLIALQVLQGAALKRRAGW